MRQMFLFSLVLVFGLTNPVKSGETEAKAAFALASAAYDDAVINFNKAINQKNSAYNEYSAAVADYNTLVMNMTVFQGTDEQDIKDALDSAYNYYGFSAGDCNDAAYWLDQAYSAKATAQTCLNGKQWDACVTNSNLCVNRCGPANDESDTANGSGSLSRFYSDVAQDICNKY